MVHQLRKIVSISLVCIFLAVLFLSQIFIITHIDHNCHGAECPVCAEIHLAEATIKLLGFALLTVPLLAGFVCFIIINTLIPKGINIFYSQVKLKVRMNE